MGPAVGHQVHLPLVSGATGQGRGAWWVRPLSGNLRVCECSAPRRVRSRCRRGVWVGGGYGAPIGACGTLGGGPRPVVATMRAAARTAARVCNCIRCGLGACKFLLPRHHYTAYSTKRTRNAHRARTSPPSHNHKLLTGPGSTSAESSVRENPCAESFHATGHAVREDWRAVRALCAPDVNTIVTRLHGLLRTCRGGVLERRGTLAQNQSKRRGRPTVLVAHSHVASSCLAGVRLSCSV